MKALLSSTLTALVLALPAFAETAPVPSKQVQIAINNVYVPGGFDSHSDVFVVINGIFPNGCYKWSHAEVDNKDTFTHEVKSIATVSQGMCLMVLIPFQKEVQLGKFAAGKHTLRFVNGDGTYIEKAMNIE